MTITRFWFEFIDYFRYLVICDRLETKRMGDFFTEKVRVSFIGGRDDVVGKFRPNVRKKSR